MFLHVFCCLIIPGFITSRHLGLSENVVYPEKPNGFADHYPYEKWLAISLGILTQHFQVH